jgi:hypothetical protein
VASPDTEELATVPLPTPAPDTEKATRPTAEAPAASAAETAPHQVIDPAATAETAPHQVIDPAATAETAPYQVAEALASPDAETAPQQIIEDPAVTAAGKAPRRQVEAPAASVRGAETVPQESLTSPAEPSATGAAGLAEPGVDERAARADRRADAAGADEDSSPETVEQAAAKPAKQGGRWWRGFTGSLAAGLTVLAVGVLVVAGVCLYTDAPGPGPVLLIGHPVAAVLALLAQRVADRRNGLPAAGAGIAVVLFVVSALTLFWLT